MIKILLSGANGKMGRAVTRSVSDYADYAMISAGFDINTEQTSEYKIYDNFADITEDIDVIIDFSHPSMLDCILDYAVKNKIPAVICTTGLSAEQVSRIEYESQFVPIFFSANMSIGVNLLIDLACKAAKLLEKDFDIEILEKHHNQKIDAPSGTALAIADALAETVSYQSEFVYDRHSVRKKRDKKEIGIHSIRGGTIVGEHDVIFAGCDEIIEIKHSAASKEVFAVGAIRAAMFLNSQKPGLYAMKDLIAAQE